MNFPVKHYILTPRLILRSWKEEDLPIFAQLNKDNEVMKYFLKKLSYEETVEYYNRIQQEFNTCGYGLYAVEKKKDHRFIGYVGFHRVPFEINSAPAIEIGWRLWKESWNKGYATEAALGCLEYARKKLNLKELYSFTSLPNKQSERIMQKIGMTKIKEFNHPLVSQDHYLCKHVLYKIEL